MCLDLECHVKEEKTSSESHVSQRRAYRTTSTRETPSDLIHDVLFLKSASIFINFFLSIFLVDVSRQAYPKTTATGFRNENDGMFMMLFSNHSCRFSDTNDGILSNTSDAIT